MYLDFYKLHLKPFQISTDPKFLWLGEKHKEALAVLKYGILDNKGFLLLTGDVGTGKTTLLNALIDSLGDDVLVALVTDPGLAKMDFFNFVADSFNVKSHFRSKGEFLIFLKNYLLDLNRQNKQALLIIDECQHLNQKLLEEVRLLSNIEKSNTKLINIFFVGQSEFNEIILRPRNRAIRQRITINYNISPLTQQETENYIRFRLEVAGSKETIFAPSAIAAVHKFSNGYPRLINIICDQALLTGYVKEKKKIDGKIVGECAEELRISPGPSLKASRATPESSEVAAKADSKPAALLPDVQQGSNGALSKPLVIALVVVLAIWLTLVVAFFSIQTKSPPDTSSTAPQPLSEAVTRPEPSTPGHASGQALPSGIQASQTGTQSSSDRPAAVGTGDREAMKPAPSPTRVGITGTPSPEKRVSVAAETTGIPVPDQISLEDIKSVYGERPEIRFGFNSNSLDADAYAMLEMIARYCVQHPDAKLVLRGYADNSGSRAYNIKLSEFRADMVRTYLIGKGVRPSDVDAIAIGPAAGDPVASGNSVDNTQRKVVVEIIPAGN